MYENGSDITEGMAITSVYSTFAQPYLKKARPLILGLWNMLHNELLQKEWLASVYCTFAQLI